MITKDMIRDGLRYGSVQLVVDPNMESGTVCQIGDYWFYFGGETAEEMEPEEYLRVVPTEDIVDEIFSALDGFIHDKATCDEYEYYEAYMTERSRYFHRIVKPFLLHLQERKLDSKTVMECGFYADRYAAQAKDFALALGISEEALEDLIK